MPQDPHKVRPLNAAALAAELDAEDMPRYPEPVLGNPVASLMESGVGNCFPGLEFDLRQLDVRFFPGLIFSFPGVTPSGPDGTQGAVLVLADTEQDPIFDLPHRWLHDLKVKLNGAEGAALGDGTWYLHYVEQYGQRVELYDYTVWQNTATAIPYEGEIAWWIIRLIELDPNPEVADLTIALTQRDANGQPSGHPVILQGKRRAYLDGEGMIPDVYRPGELTASMCSPWTHDFRDCACQYWASNHPDVALGPVEDPQTPKGTSNEHNLLDHTSETDVAQSVTFLDWMRRRKTPSTDISAQPTIELARPGRYDPFEINLHWEQLSFVLQGQEVEETWSPVEMLTVNAPYEGLDQLIEDSRHLGTLEFTLSMEYLYAYYSLRAPDEITDDEEARWPGLRNDLRAARQYILSVAISEMMHLRWVNQILWIIAHTISIPYEPVVEPSEEVPLPNPSNLAGKQSRHRSLCPANPLTIGDFVDVERPGGDLDTEYAALVEYLSGDQGPTFPPDLYQLAVRIDSDGLGHYEKFRHVQRILAPYPADPAIYLRPVTVAAPDAPEVQPALDALDAVVAALKDGYRAEAASLSGADKEKSNAARKAAQQGIEAARAAMHEFNALADALARLGIGVPFFARFPKDTDDG